MKKLLMAAAALLFCASSAQATSFAWNLTLSGANEIPANASPATGTAKLVLDDVLKTLTLDITFSGLVSTTTGAHIHCCQTTPGSGNVGVATTTPAFVGFPLGVTSGGYSGVLDLTQAISYNSPSFMGGVLADQQTALINGLLQGRTYLNIHTSQPTGCAPPLSPGCGLAGGEIRAQITALPEPATLSLLGLGLGGLIARRRRAQR